MNDAIGRYKGPIPFLFLLVVLTTGAPAHADVFRCEQDGKLTYTDTPCSAGAQPIQIATPQSIEATVGSDLATRYDERRASERRTRIRADSQWLQAHDAAKADELRVRNALVEGRVVAGMTQQQVRQVWGEPSDVQLQIDQNASRERWVYRETRGGPAGRRTVSFEDGRVAGAASGSGKSSAGHNSQSRKNADQQKKQGR